MTPTELLAELHQRGISLRVTDDGHLRLTGPAEAALTPALRAEAETARQALAALLTPEVGGSGEFATAVHPALPDTDALALPADGRQGLPGWLLWAGLAVVAAILGAAYLLGRQAAPAAKAPSSAPLPATWPYSGQSWGW
jgi:hypothetical protein